MFSYYGAKTKLVNEYPQPKYTTVVEPFAGSARYSLKYFDRNVILCEKYDKIYKVWKYLQRSTKKDILGLPDVPPSTELSTIDGFNSLCDEERWLIGLCANRGSNAPKNFSGSFCSWEKDRNRISNDIEKIRHWDIRFGDYSDIENIEATWFVDPPYQNMGKLYKENKIDYCSLGSWCSNRNGQVIVCENYGADWMDFRFLKHFGGQRKRSIEVIWTNDCVAN